MIEAPAVRKAKSDPAGRSLVKRSRLWQALSVLQREPARWLAVRD